MVQKNSVAIPDDLLSKFTVPDVNKVHFFETVTCRSDRGEQPCVANQKLSDYVDFSISVPFFIQFDRKYIITKDYLFVLDIETEFVKIDCCASTADLPRNLCAYLPIYLESMFKLSIRHGDRVIKYKDVLRMLDEETIDYDNSVGLYNASKFSVGDYSQLVKVSMKVEKSKYRRAIGMLGDFLWNTKYTSNRLKVTAQNLINAIASTKRDPEYVSHARYIIFTILIDW